MSTIKTVLHAFTFNTREPEEAAAWQALKESRKADGVKLFDTICGTVANDSQAYKYRDAFRALDGQVVELDVEYIFDDQWNSANLRLHDFYAVSVFDVRHRISGYWLEITDDMRNIRATRCKCGYCGHQMDMPDVPAFCPKCIGSEYLEVKDLHLTRMQPVINDKRLPLTEAELAERLPVYKAAQIHGNTERDKARIASLRESLLKDRDAAIKHANAEYDGMIWLLDHGVSTGNAIYYKHIEKFSFGWRTPIAKELREDMAKELEGFPFPWEFSKEK
jgi:hypothetical protein